MMNLSIPQKNRKAAIRLRRRYCMSGSGIQDLTICNNARSCWHQRNDRHRLTRFSPGNIIRQRYLKPGTPDRQPINSLRSSRCSRMAPSSTGSHRRSNRSRRNRQHRVHIINMALRHRMPSDPGGPCPSPVNTVTLAVTLSGNNPDRSSNGLHHRRMPHPPGAQPYRMARHRAMDPGTSGSMIRGSAMTG